MKLSEICHISSGGTPSRSNLNFYRGNIPWAKISDIENAKKGLLIDTEEKITEEGLKSIGNRIFPKGTLLFAMYGSIGKVAITGKEVTTNQAILGIRPKKSNEIHLPYLKVWFDVNKKRLIDQGRGVALQNLSATIIRNLQITLPSFIDQIQIANLHSKAEDLINQRKESIRLLDEFLKSTFWEMFGDPTHNTKKWASKRLDEISVRITDGKHGDCKDEENSGYYFLSAKDLNDGKLKYTDVRQITKEDFLEVHKRTNLKLNDILLGNTGASIGKIGIVIDADKASQTTFQKSISIITVIINLVNPLYLKVYLGLNRKIFNKTSSGSAMANLLLSQIRSFNILLPPIELQTQFSQIVEKTEALKAQCQSSLQELENLYGALSQRAFKGELSL